MAKHRDNNSALNFEGREEFVTANAVALLNQRDAKICEMRKHLAKLNATVRELKRARREENEIAGQSSGPTKSQGERVSSRRDGEPEEEGSPQLRRAVSHVRRLQERNRELAEALAEERLLRKKARATYWDRINGTFMSTMHFMIDLHRGHDKAKRLFEKESR